MKLSTLMIGLAVTGVVATFASFPLYKHAQTKQRARNEASAIGSLKAIANAQTLFREGDKDQDGVLAYAPDLQTLVKIGLLDPDLEDGIASGYRFVVRHHASPAQQSQYVWSATAEPVLLGYTGDRFFGANMAGLLPFSNERPVTFNSDGSVQHGWILSH